MSVPFPEEFARRYRELGYWTGETFGSFLADRAARYADSVAVVDDRHRWTYRELDERASLMAQGFRDRGIAPGERVVVQLPNVAEFVSVVFGLFRAGAVPVFALPPHRFAEVSYFCRHSAAVAYVIADKAAGFDYRVLADEVRAAAPTVREVFVLGDPGAHTSLEDVPAAPPGEFPEVDPGGLAFLQLSGGSTGVPKLIPRTHDDYLYSVRESADICGLGPDSVYLVALPVAHNFPMSSAGILGAFHAGARIVLAPAPSPDVVFPLIEREGVTITGVVPPIALVWLDSAPKRSEDLSSLRLLQVGGAKFAEESARRVRPELGCGLQQVFGMAEGLVNYTRFDDDEDTVAISQGRPISPDDELLVVDADDNPVPEGEIGHLLTRGPYTIRGYYRAEEHNAQAFTPDGFYRTGDLVRLLPSGHVVVEGRAKDQINRGGEKVAAEEVENHLLAHPGVHDAAVVAVPDAFLGERTCAFVVTVGDQPPTGPQLRAFLRGRGLAAYKIPDRVEFVPEFPHTGVGKTSRRDLRAAFTARLAAERKG
ncbi:(2,3-dihydroxybenzoyl)adenylate synthase [Actinokineospora auranticolor]|uniref:2,3-dihydroxybenzoate-AMP ligase n=1 Tax=Actinokineospora auranticolor TaxID=155976 RepID=A0A2S6GCR3_9PSEU|nr:(2,3-dihydroxybenzoyl)adenylate synthase [Actinokineospora auranticolor]PPK62592.1 2,3-dihydroxybenzoate-AMP ligase [Actinokineospora auranticolor]